MGSWKEEAGGARGGEGRGLSRPVGVPRSQPPSARPPRSSRSRGPPRDMGLPHMGTVHHTCPQPLSSGGRGGAASSQPASWLVFLAISPHPGATRSHLIRTKEALITQEILWDLGAWCQRPGAETNAYICFLSSYMPRLPFCVLIFVCSVKCRKGLFFLVVRGKDCAVASARRCPGREWRRRCAHARVCRGRTRRTPRPACCGGSGGRACRPVLRVLFLEHLGCLGRSRCHLSLESSYSNKRTCWDCGGGGMEASRPAWGPGGWVLGSARDAVVSSQRGLVLLPQTFCPVKSPFPRLLV